VIRPDGALRLQQVRLYWAAVACNVVALVILIRGFAHPLSYEGQVVSVIFTVGSVISWATYFRR